MVDRSPQHQGVLYKRRDFYTSYWRPRWFVLQDGVLTYYLLSSNSEANEEYPTISTSRPSSAQRRRSQSSSTTSSVDYDVVPRGNILLPQGCHVQAEVGMSQEGLLVFSIVAPSSGEPSSSSGGGGGGSPCYLAAATAEDRDAWMDHIKRVCHPDDPVVQRPPPLPAAPPVGEWEDEQSDDLTLSGVPSQLRDRIRAVLKEHLPYATTTSNDSDDEVQWSLLFENKDGVTSYQRNYGQSGGIMIKSEAVLDHHPKQLCNLLLDIKRRKHFETNVRHDERLKVYNSHSFLDYYAYHPVWPTSARDFLVAVHWRVLKRGDNETALCILGFSYPEENALRPPPSDHVRAHLNVTLSLLEPVGGGDNCRFTRIVSYDLRGSLPSSLSNTIMQQQARLPRILTKFLKRTEPSPPTRLTSGDLSTESIIKDILDYLPEDDDDDGLQIDRVRRRLRFTDSSRGSSVAGEAATAELARSSVHVETDKEDTQPSTRRSIWVTAIILFTPLLTWRVPLLTDITSSSSFPVKELIFCIAAYHAVRLVVLEKLGSIHPSRKPAGGSTIVVRVPVNLKGALRLLATRRRQEEDGSKSSSAVISVSHVAARAIAQALGDQKDVFFEWVGSVRGWRRPSSLRLSMSDVALPASSTVTGKLPLSPLMALEQVAEELKTTDSGSTSRAPSSITSTLLELLHLSSRSEDTTNCYLYTNSERGSELEMGVTPPEDAALVVVLGGVRLTKTLSARGSPRRTTSKPTMLVTLSFNAAAWSVCESRAFASRVRQLLELPEDE